MKCPKCHYLSFEPEPRCRNCGYDLSLSTPADLDLRTATPYEGPLIDLNLRAPSDVDEMRNAVTLGPIDLDRVVGHEPEPADTPPVADDVPVGPAATVMTAAAVKAGPVEPPPLRVVPAPARSGRPAHAKRSTGPGRAKPAPSTTAELPLFVKNRPDVDPDAPLVKVPATPTPPLAVRRAQDAPKPTRHADAPTRGGTLAPFERDLLNDFKRLEQRVVHRARESEPVASPVDTGLASRRLAAAAIDATVLGTISAGVLWATLRLCDLGLGEAATLPIVPLGAFLLLVAAGYLVMFTVAGGQTLGKMLLRIRVVGDDGADSEALSPQQAAVRALLSVPSVLLFGLGFLPALRGAGLAIHDRLSHTRVIEA